MSLFIYNIVIRVYYLALNLAAFFNPKAKSWIQGRKQTRQSIKQTIFKDFKDAILIHAASLGEFEQVRPLIELIKQEHPTQKIILSFFSPSGYEVRKNYTSADKVIYLPFDFKSDCESFLTQLKPKLIIIVRYEFWLNFIQTAHDQQIPIYLLAASFRPQQIFFKSYGTLFRKALQQFEHIFVSQQNNIELLKVWSINQVTYAPDTRMDRVISIAENKKELPVIDQFLAGQSCLLVAGSTWNADLSIISDYINLHPTNKYIIAPHHIDEQSVLEIEKKLTIPNIRYSTLSANFEANKNVLIIDNFGMLSALYFYGKYAYIGGGFGTSVHNVLEAAVYGKPVFFGPNNHKAQECKELINQKAAFEIHTAKAFEDCLNELEANPINYQSVANQASNYVHSKQGGTRLIYHQIEKFFS